MASQLKAYLIRWYSCLQDLREVYQFTATLLLTYANLPRSSCPWDCHPVTISRISVTKRLHLPSQLNVSLSEEVLTAESTEGR